jgi:hypothetical protein
MCDFVRVCGCVGGGGGDVNCLTGVILRLVKIPDCVTSNGTMIEIGRVWKNRSCPSPGTMLAFSWRDRRKPLKPHDSRFPNLYGKQAPTQYKCRVLPLPLCGNVDCTLMN